MPEIALSDVEILWFWCLLAVWAGLLFGGFFFGKLNAEGEHRIPRPMRMGASLALVVAGWSWWLAAIDTPAESLALAVAVGMTFGLVGDLALARLLPLGEWRILAGIGFFGVGHVAYIVGLLRYGDETAEGWGSLLVAWVVAAVLWFLVVYRDEASVVHFVALPYALLLASTAGVGFGLALQAAGFVWLALGAVLFLISDLVLATELFNGRFFRGIGDVVWLTYSPGQMLIVYAVPLASLL
jgi:hypothetical protein